MGLKQWELKLPFFVSVPTLPFNYDEPDEYRLDPDTDEIPYDWILDESKKTRIKVIFNEDNDYRWCRIHWIQLRTPPM
nr:RNA polymerase-associated LEO1 family protein [Methanobacterium formicicum]